MKKILTFLILFVSVFTTKVYAASNINITDTKVIEKSSTITVENPVLENNTISSKIKFNQLNDYVIYELTLKNNDSYDYKIDEVVDNNTNSNLLIEYDYSKVLLTNGSGTLRIKLTYKNKLVNVDKITLDDLKITMNLTKSDGSKTSVNISNPKTGDNILKYVFVLIISVLGLLLIKKNHKNKKMKIGNLLIITSILMIPFSIFAAENFEIKIGFFDIEIKGIYEYTVTFDPAEGQVTQESVLVDEGETINEFPTPTRDGYDFTGWYDGSTLVQAPYTPTQDVTLTAHWQETVSLITYTDSDNSGTINLGDTVKLGEDNFYVIGTENGKVKLLAKYNLDSNNRQSEDNYTEVAFSDTSYWFNEAGSGNPEEEYEGYNRDDDQSPYVYRNENNEETSNNLKTYINNYKNYLKNDVGISVIEDARLMSYNETHSTGCGYYVDNSCPEYVSNQLYWIGSAQVHNMVYCVDDTYDNIASTDYGNTDFKNGIRPLIIIPESAISTQ